jgi:hypothetical protein
VRLAVFFACVVSECWPFVRGLKNGIIWVRFALCAAAHLALNLSASNGMPLANSYLNELIGSTKSEARNRWNGMQASDVLSNTT